jgi:hypothetical protein
MRGVRSPGPTDGAKRRAALKERAAAARVHAAATKAWTAHVTTAAAGTIWRVSASWIDESSKMRCAELTNVCSGKIRTIRLPESANPESCREQILAET